MSDHASTSLPRTLPTSWYRDEKQFRLELDQIWKQEWLCLGHSSGWKEPGAFRRVDIGDEQVLVVRQPDDSFRAYFNTCRHRGAQLCGETEGVFGRGRIICPYHAWAYDLEGRLSGAPGSREVQGFDAGQFSLYPVALKTWRGFLFINLAEQAAGEPQDGFDVDPAAFDPWPLESLALVHSESHDIACNWKVFWENFLECYHCPKVHPDLCRLVPVYGTGWNDRADLPEGHRLREAASTLKDGAVTWSDDGQTPLPWFDGMGPEQQSAGMTYVDSLPGMFIVAHVDYVRSVQILPVAPEQTRLRVDWLVAPAALEKGPVDIERLAATGRQVVMEDAEVCEINQRGLRCGRHESGVLMPREKDLRHFHDWVRGRLA